MTREEETVLKETPLLQSATRDRKTVNVEIRGDGNSKRILKVADEANHSSV